MNINRKKWWILILIIIATAILFTILAAPNNNKLLAGSTFGKNPNGYGAWYEYMLERDITIERWQKPFSELPTKQKISFLKILPPQTRKFYRLSNIEKKWLEKGNTMVVLGIDAPPSYATFTTTQSYQDLDIQIATTRRTKLAKNSILQDDYGSIVWQKNIGKGIIIYAVTPYLAANAYQNNLDNYEFLTQLVSENSLILVDEYLHGYKDREVINQEKEQKQNTLLNYFSKTIWLPIAVQIIIMIIIAIASKFRRFGQATLIPKITIDNSKAYIQALAGVLEKAECSDFLVSKIIKDERLQLQQLLGLGKGNISDEILLNGWKQATGKDTKKLQKLLKFYQSKPHFKYSELSQWLKQWQQFHHK